MTYQELKQFVEAGIAGKENVSILPNRLEMKSKFVLAAVEQIGRPTLLTTAQLEDPRTAIPSVMLWLLLEESLIHGYTPRKKVDDAVHQERT